MKNLRDLLVAVILLCSAAMSQQPSGAGAPAAAPAPDQVVAINAPIGDVSVIVAAAARDAAKDIIARKRLNDPATFPPLQPFTSRAPKLVVFALAAVADPAKSKDVSFSPSYIAAVETHRTDKQVGASAASSGSTSAADKPGIPYLLGLAIEHGAIAQNISDSTLTLSSSPYALVAALTHEDTAQTYYDYRGLTRFAVSASYNLQDANSPLASVRRQQLAEWSVKLRLFGDHSARSEAAHQLFVEKVLPALQKRADTLAGGLADIVGGDPWFSRAEAFKDQTRIALQAYISDPNYDENKAEDGLTKIIVDGLKDHIYSQVAALGITQSQQARLSQFLSEYKLATDAYVRAAGTLDEALKELEKKPTLTLGYFNERGAAGSPNYSVGKLIYEKKPEGFMQIDANISVSAYSNPDRAKNQQTFRDATAALQFQQNLGRSPFLFSPADKNPISLSFAGRYERLQENRHVPGKKADIAVANWKLEIPVASGVSLPLSITYANATELIKEHDIRGNFGITFDLDKLKSVVSAK